MKYDRMKYDNLESIYDRFGCFDGEVLVKYIEELIGIKFKYEYLQTRLECINEQLRDLENMR